MNHHYFVQVASKHLDLSVNKLAPNVSYKYIGGYGNIIMQFFHHIVICLSTTSSLHSLNQIPSFISQNNFSKTGIVDRRS